MDVVSTAEVPAGERFDFWREVSSKLWVPYDLRCEPGAEDRFEARVGISGFGAVQATLMTTTPHAVRRTPKLIRQTDPEVLKVGCILRGRGMLEQDGRRADYGVGDLVLFDTSRPYVAEFAPDVATSQQLLLLRFPRELLPLPARHVRDLSAVRIPGTGAIGALSSQFLLHLARNMEEFSSGDTARLSTLTLDVLTAALGDALDARSSVPLDTRRRALVARIDDFVRRNLGDPCLTPDAIAVANHISLRYLHKLFQQEGRTVAGWVREQRLERCRRDLADPRLDGRPISAIAARWGFTSAAHFSQAFRAAYGMSPRQFRAVHAN